MTMFQPCVLPCILPRVLPRVLAFSLAFALVLASGAGAEAQIRIGLAAPLTGPDAAFGQGMRAAAEQAVSDLNRAGGVNGQKLALVAADDSGDAKQGLAAVKRFSSEKVGFVVGPLNSSVASVAVPAYEAAGIVVVTPGASWGPLTNRGHWNVFRTCGSDPEQGLIAGLYLAEAYRGRRVGIVHDRTAFGRGLADEVVRTLKASGETEAAFEGFDRGERDLSRLVGRLARARVEVVYLGGLAGDAVTLVRALRGAGLAVPLVGSDGLIDRDFVAEAEGTLMTAAPEPRKLPEVRAAEVRNPAGRLMRTAEAEVVAGQTYAAVEVLARAIDLTKSTDARKVAAFLHTGQAVKTLIGDLAYDTRGDLRRSGYALYAWRRTGDGRIDYLGNQISP